MFTNIPGGYITPNGNVVMSDGGAGIVTPNGNVVMHTKRREASPRPRRSFPCG